MPRPKKVKTETPTGKFAVSLSYDRDVFTAQGDSIEEGLLTIAGQMPRLPKMKGILKLAEGTRASELTVFPFQLRRMRIVKKMRELFAKRLLQSLH